MGLITGTINDDNSLNGTSGNDTINALGGVDWIMGSAGNDSLNGGDGSGDVVMYGSLAAGVFINNTAFQVGTLGAYRVLKSGGQQDTLVGIEAVHGTQYADKIYIGSNTYVFAEGGNDEIHVGTSVLVFAGSGNDTIYGAGAWLDYNAGDPVLQTRGIVAMWNTATSGIVTEDGWENHDRFYGINRISGSIFADVITGNIGNDSIFGVDGDDYLSGNGGADSIDGGDGDDLLFGGAGDDEIVGGSGDDSIYGGAGSNLLNGGDGNDVYFVQSDVYADDKIEDAGGDADILQVLDTMGRDAYRFVYSNAALVHETAQGHRTEIALDQNGVPVVEYLQWMGSDEYGTDNYTNTLRIITDLSNISGRLIVVAGTDGADTIVMPNETPQDGEYWGEVYANGGDDDITLSSTMMYVTYAGEGNDYVGGLGDIGDIVDGEAGDDYIEGNGGDDSLYGAAGFDQLFGGAGDDSLDGGGGGSSLHGGSGNDTLIGGGNDDFITGGSGNDFMDGGSGGWDHLEYFDATSGITVNKNDSSSGTVVGVSSGTDSFVGIEIVAGSDYNDTFNGSAGDDFFNGNKGADTFNGGDGFDGVVYDLETLPWLDNAGTHGVIVNMSDESVSVNINQGAGFQTVAANSAIDSFGRIDRLYDIEQIVGTQFDDHLTGNSSVNNLIGQDGNDTLIGGGGYDTLEGGAGNDLLIATGEAFGAGEIGSHLVGGAGDDTLISDQTSTWGAQLYGGLGSNTIYGNLDTWNAGDGDDLNFTDLTDVGGVSVVQGENGSGTAISGDERVFDIFQYIQFFNLTSENDSIFFSDDDKWKGVAPGAGDDTIVGGAGYDDLFYDVDTGRGISLNALAGVVLDPWGNTDHFSGIESFEGSHSDDFMSAAGVAFGVYIEGNNGNDLIIGGNDADRLLGDAGNDSVYGGDGNDIMFGGTGDDWFYGGTGTNIIDGGEGNDIYIYREGETTVTDDSGENWLRFERGEAGYLTRFYQTEDGSLVVGRSSGSSMTITNYQSAIVGFSWVPVNNQVGWSAYSLSLTDTAIGTLGADTLVTSDSTYIEGYASDGDDTIYINATQSSWVTGDGGSDLIYGGAGRDTIRGDWNSSDSGNDTIFGGDGNDSIDGGNGNDSLKGDSGNDTLDGGTGNDSLTGGTGNDTYVVDSASDLVVEQFNQGVDLVQSTAVSYTLANYTENLTLTGTGAINGTGNSSNNILTGNTAANSLSGGGGNDTILGGEGNDTLDGGVGNDTLNGGAGDDTYLVDGATDVVVETVTNGTDLVQSTAAAYTLADNVENLTLMGIAAINGTGNAGNNVLTGNAAANIISGGGGNDTIIGGAGNDSIEGAAGDDKLTGGDGTDTASYNAARAAVTVDLTKTVAQNTVGAGMDTLLTIENLIGSAFGDILTGDALANSLSGGAGHDNLTGGAGNDTLDGGAGNDTLIGGLGTDVASYASAALAVTVDLNLVTAQDTGGGGTDTLATIENLIGSIYNDRFTGTATANQFEGGAGADTLIGGGGADLLYGGEGDDRFFIALSADHATGEIVNGGGGTDELRFTSITASTLTLTTGVAVEKVVIGTGTAANADSSGLVALNVNAALAANGITMIGNAGANILTGSGFNDSLDGGAGSDSLVGGVGNDTLSGGNGNDTLLGGAGSDVFVFNLAPNATTNKDTISDFVAANDDIWLSKSVMAGLGLNNGALASTAFWSGAGVTTSHDGDDRVIYNLTTGALYYDEDGNGTAAAVQIAQLQANTALSYLDFVIIG